MNTVMGYRVAMNDNLSEEGGCLQLVPAKLDHQGSTPTKPIPQDSHTHEAKYPSKTVYDINLSRLLPTFLLPEKPSASLKK